MKVTCLNLACRQNIECPDDYRGQIVPCPTCQTPIFVPKKTLLELVKKYIPIIAFLNVYFDLQSVSPSLSSPYGTVIQLIRGIYRGAVGLLLFTFLMQVGVGIYTLFHWSTNLYILIIPLAIMTTTVLWLGIHCGYKLIVVVFDCAEYLRQLTLK